MKSKIKLIIVSILAITVISSCSKDKNTSITPEQQVILNKMEATYITAKSYDDSLISAISLPVRNSSLLHHYDMLYHANDTIFMNCHTSMMNTSGGIMTNYGRMMGGSGGMMGNNNTQSMTTNNAEFNQVMSEMNQLRETHIQYHPK